MLGEVAQLALNGVMAGTILAVPAIGFTAIYAVLRFPNFAVASHLTIGAFAKACRLSPKAPWHRTHTPGRPVT